MDPVTLAATVTALLAPYLAKASQAIADKAIEQLPDHIGKLWTAVTHKFSGKPAAEGAASDLAAKADDADNQEAFSLQLKKMLKDDPAFTNELAALLDKAQKAESISNQGSGAVATHGGVAASAGEIAISGNVEGNISIGNNNTTIKNNG